MAKTKTFRVENGRMLFKCNRCKSKRMIAVGQGVRSKSQRCSQCGESTRCVFNRRMAERESQSGTIFLKTGDGGELTVSLYDVSLNGVGFDLLSRDMNKIVVGRKVQFNCSWNPRLLSSGLYVVRSVKDQRVGVEKFNA